MTGQRIIHMHVLLFCTLAQCLLIRTINDNWSFLPIRSGNKKGEKQGKKNQTLLFLEKHARAYFKDKKAWPLLLLQLFHHHPKSVLRLCGCVSYRKFLSCEAVIKMPSSFFLFLLLALSSISSIFFLSLFFFFF